MPAWETYCNKLLSRGHGHAIWDADPGADPAVEIGDVGYMEEGIFVRLFNASKEIGDLSNKFGTPDGYKPLRIGAIREGTLSASLPITSETVLQRKVAVSLSGGPIVQPGGGFVFECTKEQGAVLILGEDADRRNALQKQSFIRYVLGNHGTWVKFANDVHERGVSLDQLLLVTGCDRTSVWACAAFSASSNKLGLEFRVGNVAVAQGGISVWGSWNNCQSVQVNSGPRGRQTQPSDSQPRAKELEAADILSREKHRENGLLSAVDDDSQATTMGHVVRLVDEVKNEQDTQSLSQDEECYSATPDTRRNMILSRIMLCSRVLGRMLVCICSYIFSVVFGSSLSHPAPSFRILLSEVIGRTHDTPKSSPNTEDSHSSRDQPSEKPTVPSPTTTSKTPSPSPRNQCVFLRGFKVCDRSTMKKRMRLLGRKKSPPEDGFMHLNRSKRDDKDDPGRSRGSSSSGSSYSFWDRDSASGNSRSTGGNRSTVSSSQSQYGSQYSLGPSIATLEADSVSIFDTQSDHEFALYQQCREWKQPTHLDILMEYILEYSPAELALVHHDDLATMLEHVGSMSSFESELFKRAPTIFIENGVGMLESTFIASRDSNSTNDVIRRFTPSLKQVSSCEVSRLLGANVGSMNAKRLESALSFVRSDLTSTRAENLLIPWVLQAYGNRYVKVFSPTLRPSYSSPRMIMPDAIFLEENCQVVANGGEVKEKTISRFSTLERWKPTDPRHIVSIPGANGPYFEVSKRYITEWIDAHCNGAPAAPEPPNSDMGAISCHVVSSCFNSERGFTALSFVLSNRSPHVGLPKLGTFSKISSVWGPGHATGNALKWLGEKFTSTMEYTVIMTCSRRHISLLRRWERIKEQVLGFEKRFIVLRMLEDALEISRECYPARLNRMAYNIGRQVQHWLQSFSLIPQTAETTQWLIQVHICLMSLLLSRISRLDPIMKNLAHDVLSNLTRIPISLQEHSIPAAVICLLVNELLYSQHKYQHSWLGVWLARIVELSLTVRRLTEQEVTALAALAMRRKNDQSIVCSIKCCRPWEIALFSQIATQVAWFKPIVLDIHGFPSLVNALACMLADNINRHAVHWSRVALTLRAMSFSLEQEWVASIVKPRIILSLLRVFRRSIPEKWFCIRFWAADAIRNVVAHQPSLVQTLLKENAVAALGTLADPKLDFGPGRSAPVNRRVNEIKTSVQNRLFEQYKREGLKRAAELVVYIEQWTPESLPVSKLEAVTPGWGGYLGGIEEGSH